MNCQFCENPATVHLTNIQNKVRREIHLCEACARKQELIKEEESPPAIDLKALLSLLMKPAGEAVEGSEAESSPLICASCGLKYEEFRAEGRLGCANDYEEFRTLLVPLLERIHRAVLHEGKAPRSVLRKRTKSELRELRKKLQKSVKAEKYEDAARLRDLIREKEAQDEPR